MAEFTSLANCKARLQKAVDQFILTTSGEYAGNWRVDCTDDALMLIWECEENDPRVQAMGPDVPPEYRDAGISDDAPWAMWGGNKIIDAAEIGDDWHGGADAYQDRYGDNIVSQFVRWDFP